MSPSIPLDRQDKHLLQAVQRGIPLVRRPFAPLAEALGVEEAEVLARLNRLRHEQHVIRQISAIFDTQALGYHSSLVAAQYPADRLEAAAAIISDHPGVSHNYQRDSRFNLWYTLAVGPDSALGLEQTTQRLHAMTGALATRLLPTLKLYKIGVQLRYDGQAAGSAGGGYTQAARDAAARCELTDRDRAVIRVAQQDLPLVAEPFEKWAAQADCDLTTFCQHLQRFLDRRQMRRFAAVLHHRTAGFTANAMTVWQAEEHRIDQCGRRLAEFNAVSHCYRRPSYDDWPYNLYTMVHARSQAESDQTLRAMQQATGIDTFTPLWTRREFKKVRLQYFTGAIKQWENRTASDPP